VILCAIIGDIKAQNTFRGHQNFQQVPGWQNRVYQNNQYTTRRPYYEAPAANIKPPFVPQSARQNAIDTTFKSQPNYGFKPQSLSPSSKATILKQEYERFPDGGYRFL
jgi:hypothetical protein